jgi:hypothetical protein
VALLSTLTIAAVETVVLALPIPAGLLYVGASLDIEAIATLSVGANVTWGVRVGTTGTTADSLFATPGAGAATAMSFFKALVAVRIAGANGTLTESAHASSDTSSQAVAGAAKTFLNMGVALFLSLTASVDAGTLTVANARITQTS